MQPAMLPASPPLTILGGGFGGLTLGKCLLQKGIRSTIYEKSPKALQSSRSILLESRAYKPLLSALEIDHSTFLRKTALGIEEFVDGVESLLPKVDAKHHSDLAEIYADVDSIMEEITNRASFGSFRARREVLNSILGEGQDVRDEHRITSINQSTDGSLDINFQGCPTIRPEPNSWVVDSLGVHSILRNSLIPNQSFKILPYVVFNGTRTISQSVFDKLYYPSMGEETDGDQSAWLSGPQKAGSPRLETYVKEYDEDNRKVNISYTYSRPAHSDPDSDPLYNPARSFSEAVEIPKAFYKELRAFMKESELEEPFKNIFAPKNVRKDGLLNWLMRSILIPKETLFDLLDHGIVMIGDSVHATPILGGKGANTAISDAVQLADLISQKGLQRSTFEDFYNQRWDHWRDEVEASEARIAEMHLPED